MPASPTRRGKPGCRRRSGSTSTRRRSRSRRLGSAGTLAVYKASAAGQTSRLVGFNSASQTLQLMFWAANQCFLNHGQALYLVASTTLTNYYIGAEEAIAEQAWKVFD